MAHEWPMVSTMADSVVLLASLAMAVIATGMAARIPASAARAGNVGISVFRMELAIQSRGLVCERWRSFSSFYFDVGKGRPDCIC
jgi:hypothetical protein